MAISEDVPVALMPTIVTGTPEVDVVTVGGWPALQLVTTRATATVAASAIGRDRGRRV
ncbi:MAG: hypothetical protein ACR2P2_09900 [Nakamurella sp.]